MQHELTRFDLRIELIAAAVALHQTKLDGCTDAEATRRFERFIEARSAAPNDEALRAVLRLDADEMQIVWLLAATVVDPETRRRLSPAGQLPILDPSMDSLAELVWGGSRSRAVNAFGAEGALRRLGIIERSDGSSQLPPHRQTWGLSKRVFTWLEQDGAGTQERIVGERALAVSAETIGFLQAATTGAPRIVCLTGVRGSGRRTTLEAMVPRLETRQCQRLPAEPSQLRARLRELALECRLVDATPLLCNLDAMSAEQLTIVETDFAPLVEGHILVTCGADRPKVEWNRPVVVVSIGEPTHEQRARLWHAALAQGTEGDADLLASRYPLAPGMIVRAAAAATTRAGARAIEPQDVYAGIKTVLDDGLGQFAKRLAISQTWDDVVLPHEQIDALIELMARVRGRRRVLEDWGFAAKVGRGFGVSALFSGPPGTGKTMVAGLIAKEIGLEIYQVDMAKVVSKFIGETERNLASVFDAAEAGHAVLLFDEADGLFGKRTEVKSSNDRYANFETNYLLQRLESFTGVCVLTTNHESSMDPAFRRRLSLHLRFALPEADERARLWRAVIPARAPLAGEIDFAALGSRFAMSGGYIKNAALRAAFVAADRGEAISAAHLEHAARLELEGTGRLPS